MKLDKIKFAMLIAFIQMKSKFLLDAHDMAELDALIDVEVPEAQVAYPHTSDINNLMALSVFFSQPVCLQ